MTYSNKKGIWHPFTTDTGLHCKYKFTDMDFDFNNPVDVCENTYVKLVTKVAKGYYYSVLNQAGCYFDEHVFPIIKANELSK